MSLISPQLSLTYFNKISCDNFYIKQVNGYGIGNFINCTPAIKLLSNYYGSQIKVYFENKVIEKMYANSKYIEVLKKIPQDLPCLFKSSLVNARVEDWLYILKRVKHKLSLKTKEIPEPFVDEYEIPQELMNKKYVVIARGMVENNDYWIKMKDPGDAIYKYMIQKLSKNFTVVFIGAKKDYDHFIKIMNGWANNYVNLIDDIQKSLGAIKHASYVISNDTGMYHVASALKVPTFTLWKNTKFRKNKASSKETCYSFKNNWFNDFDKFLDLRLQ